MAPALLDEFTRRRPRDIPQPCEIPRNHLAAQWGHNEAGPIYVVEQRLLRPNSDCGHLLRRWAGVDRADGRRMVVKNNAAADVMIADANPLTRWSIAQYLGRWSTITTAMTLAEIRRWMNTHKPLALIIGDEFPDGTSDEVIEEIQEAWPETKIIHLCVHAGHDPQAGDGNGNGTTAAADEDGDGDAVVRIDKPFDLKALARIIGFDAPSM